MFRLTYFKDVVTFVKIFVYQDTTTLKQIQPGLGNPCPNLGSIANISDRNTKTGIPARFRDYKKGPVSGFWNPGFIKKGPVFRTLANILLTTSYSK